MIRPPINAPGRLPKPPMTAASRSVHTVLAAATLRLPNGVRDEQRVSQGGIYDPGSLNIVRSSNALYTFLQDTFDELLQMDDNEPVSAQVLDQAYTLINAWRIPILSFRFLLVDGPVLRVVKV